MPVIFIEPLIKKYKNNLISLSTCFTVSFILLGFSVPFFLVFSAESKKYEIYLYLLYISTDFWSLIHTTLDQPSITFNNQLLLQVIDDNNMKFYSSLTKVNELYNQFDKIFPILKVRTYFFNILNIIKIEKTDENNDYKTDQYKIKLSFNSNTETTTDIKLMFFFEYSLENEMINRYITNTMVYFHFDSYLGISEVKSIGEIKLKQRYPLKILNEDNYLFEESIFDISAEKSIDFLSIFQEYNNRNFTTYFQGESFITPYKSTDIIDLEFILTVPYYEEIEFFAPILYTLKQSWIKYFSTFVPIIIIFYLILQYAFKSKILKGYDETMINDSQDKKGVVTSTK